MDDFEYYAPGTVEEALALLTPPQGQAKPLAGGTDLIVQLREGARSASRVVDIKKIPSLNEITWLAQGGLRLGAAVSCSRLQRDAAVLAAYPAVQDVVRIIGAWQIQSRASLGGNLCNASPAADATPMLIAYNVQCEIRGQAATRVVPAHAFCTAPGKNVLQPGELLTALLFPAKEVRTGAAYERFIPRNEMDIAVVGAASWLKLSDGGDVVEDARVALGAVAPTAVVAGAVCDQLKGGPATAEAFAAAAELAVQAASPISDMRGPAEYRLHLTKVLVKHTLANALARARDNV